MRLSNFHFLLPVSYFGNFDAQHLKMPVFIRGNPEAVQNCGSACADKSPGAAAHLPALHVFTWVIYSRDPTGLERCPEVTMKHSFTPLNLWSGQGWVPIHQIQNLCDPLLGKDHDCNLTCCSFWGCSSFLSALHSDPSKVPGFLVSLSERSSWH